jgi:VWFA-related protein
LIVRNCLATVVFSLASLLSVSALCARAQVQATPPVQTTAPNGQGGHAATYTLQLKTQAVVLDVVVTDRNGKIVDGLTKDDFEVYENKLPQKIRYFEAPSSHAANPKTVISINSTAELDAKEPNAPVTILVLDEINTKFEDEAFTRYSLKKYLDTQGDVLPQPTLFVAVNLQHFIVLQDYTTSKKEILAALDHHLTSYPWQQMSGSWQAEQFNMVFASLMQVAEATAGHPGHKAMIWIGRGFPSVDPTQMTAESAESLREAIETCTNALRDARVVLYTLDPAGLSGETPAQDENGFETEDPFGGDVDFEEMAKETGGEAFHGRNDVDNLIGTSARDAASFYTLSYSPSVQSDETKAFRNINIKMKNRELHAATREGYYTNTPPPPPAEDAKGKLSNSLVFDLTTAARTIMVYDAAPIQILRDTANLDNFSLTINSSDVPWKDEDHQKLSAEITVLVESFDRKGKMLDRKAAIRTVQVPNGPDGATPISAHLRLLATIGTKAPAARLRFVVRVDGNGKIGADNFYLVDKSLITDPLMGETHK